MEAIEKHQEMLKDIISKEMVYPTDRFDGRGIVICAGGNKYFPCAWVCINMIRKIGCDLPIQLWYLGEQEMTKEMKALLAPFNVEFINAYIVRDEHPARILNGWELKPYSIINSRFKEVILLDADNVVLDDPEKLFSTDQYKETGAIFWPDYGRLEKHRDIWKICMIEYEDEPEFESGQIVIDKERCWKALNLTMHLNEHSDFYYRYIHGDKETYHMAWKMLGQKYSMVPHRIKSLTGTMCQHNFDGKVIFQHRNMRKWTLDKPNSTVRGFEQEGTCLSLLEELRKLWKRPEPVPSGMFTYVRVGYDQRKIELKPNGTIGLGSGGMEKKWEFKTTGEPTIVIKNNANNPTCELVKQPCGVWYGRWLSHEKMPIVLVPT